MISKNANLLCAIAKCSGLFGQMLVFPAYKKPEKKMRLAI
jgi:hypothetical protein